MSGRVVAAFLVSSLLCSIAAAQEKNANEELEESINRMEYASHLIATRNSVYQPGPEAYRHCRFALDNPIDIEETRATISLCLLHQRLDLLEEDIDFIGSLSLFVFLLFLGYLVVRALMFFAREAKDEQRKMSSESER